MTASIIFKFIGKLFIVDAMVVLLRWAFYALVFNAWIKNPLHYHADPQTDFIVSAVEMVSIFILLAVGYSIWMVAGMVFVLTMLLQYVTDGMSHSK